MNKIEDFKHKESGAIAITVTMIIMVLITLVVLSFSLVVRREQRQSLDRQLSTQAFYAAESGVQAAAAFLGANNNYSTNNCNEFNNISGYSNEVADNVSYTCVLIDNKPSDWVANSVDPNGSVVVPISTTGQPASLRISWENDDGTENFASSSAPMTFPQSGGDNLGTGVLRATLMKASQLDRASLINNAQTMFLYPKSGSGDGSTAYDPVNSPQNQSRPTQGAIVSGNCDAGKTDSHACSVKVNLSSTDRNNKYYLHIMPLYHKVKIKVEAYDINGNRLQLEDTQAVVDVTGKAADVLRRIQVRIPIGAAQKLNLNDNLMPDAALESTTGICKKLLVANNNVSNQCN